MKSLVTPATHVRVVLAHHRTLGTDFETAWSSALRSLPKGHNEATRLELRAWKKALRDTKYAFREAYAGTVLPECEAAAALIEAAEAELAA